jgi:aminoglycoside phosphotransferase (APT) family kinase protein
MRGPAERDAPGLGWARAKAILLEAFRARAGRLARVEVGRVTRIGQGLSRDIFAAGVAVDPDPGNLSGPCAVLLPRRDADRDLGARTSREARLLEQLARLDLPFRVPEVIGLVPEDGRPVLVRRFLDGVELDLRAGQQPAVRPWEIVAQLAAPIHGIRLAGFEDLLPGYATRRGHAEAALQVFGGLAGPEARDAHAWARAHLPSDAPAAFVHGDLLGQNILLWSGAEPAVIDWEYAVRGDPAYDLAIVTRGTRQPFQTKGGLELLLEAYAAAGGLPVTAPEVRLHELCLAAGWYREALRGMGPDPPEQALGRLRGILRRADAARA